ncbi:MAG: mechanosensitive ion channel [Alphaproteobacteria bacterium]|jgi:small conductance mechanosensitive channel|nr:mechanosensitive ion channel [Alphaproteobacteria bacterium]MBU0805338.1 mechanosensitive ion channel [Alphaproteobacteria bacterium]MBU0873284.1 mechanosensitive ion channel [Alphaproteobacteria bacterium]MBU1401488.1 mechanosensitive ion channel [Alphaproteobacteria bacterium]MBU1592095.1 mechanosensitive ion channel [Alphaproteobacteria bacterium]
MDLDPTTALTTLQVGLAELSSLIVSYAFSAVGAVLLLIVGYVAAGIAKRSVYSGLGQINGFDETLRGFFAKLARYAVLVLVIVMVLGQFGVQTASIIAAIGAIGLAIGLALQGTLQNIAAGIMLLALRPLRVGEYVEAGGVSGTIEEIGLFATRLKALDGLYVLAPNSTLWNVPVINYSRNALRRNDLTIGIGYSDDIDLAQKVMLDLAQGEARILGEPEPTTFVSELGDSAVSVTLRYWTSTSDFFATKLDMTKAAKLGFDRVGISIPFPQQEISYRDLTKAS